MARNISAQALAKLTTRYGVEPINILGVTWINEPSPALTLAIPLSRLNYDAGLGTLGSIQITNRQAAPFTVDLSAAQTVGDIVDAIHAGTVGIHAAININQDGLKITDVTGATTAPLMIANTGGTDTASRLGLAATTAASVLEGAGLKMMPPTLYYADRTVAGIPGKILEVSDLDSVIQVSANDDSQQIHVVLDDTDGTIKSILDSHDVHQRDVRLFQYFDGLGMHDRFLLFKGKISSPLTWREGDRTVAFDVISQIEDTEVGFSPEEGQFEHIPEDLIGQAWPICFGTCVHLEAVRLTESYFGSLGKDLGIVDFTLPYWMFSYMDLAAYALQNLNDWLDSQGFLSEADCRDRGTAQQIKELEGYLANRATYLDRKDEAAIALAEQAATIVAPTSEATGSHSWSATPTSTSFIVFGGEDFPQGQTITLDIGGAKFTGSFSGNTFNVTSARHPRAGEDLTIPRADGAIVESGWGFSFVPNGNVSGDRANYFFAEAGTSVRLDSPVLQKYVVSITPGTVRGVKAFVRSGGRRFLADVPMDWYTVSQETYGTIMATVVTMDDALSKRTDMDWEDELYVTFESTIGPNTVDILQYLIEQHTDFKIDWTSFNHVKSRLANYPSHFALKGRKQILTALQEITFQARCSMRLKDDTFYLWYLPEEPTSQATITESDIEAGTLELGFTSTEDLVTKLIATWRATGAQHTDNKVILRHNVAKYGTKERTVDFYIYNNVDLVIKAATFWLIRWCNTWKRVSFKTPLHLLNLETLDAATLDFNAPWVANVPVKSVLEQASYDSESMTMTFECWTPVRAGEMVPYDFAYPADIDQTLVFPTANEITEGNAGGSGIGTGAIGTLPERQDYSRGVRVRFDGPADPFGFAAGGRRTSDYGAKKMSDLGDVYPGAPMVYAPAAVQKVTPGSEPNPWNATTFYKAGGTSVIDIATTKLIDSRKLGGDGDENTALMSTFFAEISGGKLKMSTEATVVQADDRQVQAPFDYKYDITTQKFGAGTAFFQE